MKILCVTPWRNTWVPYWTRYIESRGHELRWFIGPRIADGIKDIEWCDKVLSHWADKSVIFMSRIDNMKPLYVILRSYEIFNANGWANLEEINWINIKKLFMLNEAHYHMFKRRVANITPTFIKNGVDLAEWQSNGTLRDRNQIAFVADINEKKGIELLVQANYELNKINPEVRIEHIGRNQDIRRTYYLNTVLPKLKGSWFNSQYCNNHDFVRNFLKDKKFIISTSIAEGNPMNLIEAMAMGVIPLVHNWPGASIQFPEECVWTTFDELKDCYTRLDKDELASSRMRAWAEEKYDFRNNYKPVIDAMEEK